MVNLFGAFGLCVRLWASLPELLSGHSYRFEMADLLIEYVGGPKDGEQSRILKKTPRDRPTFPLEIYYTEFDSEQQVERRIGTYQQDQMNDAGFMRYLWGYRGEHAKG